MTDDQLANALIRLAADKGADEHAVSSMGLAVFAGVHASAISGAFDYVDVADLDADTLAAYRAFRDSVMDPLDLETLPRIPVSV